MIHRVEILGEVNVYNVFVAVLVVFLGFHDRHVSTPLGSKPIAVVRKRRFKHWGQHLHYRLLDYPVNDGRYSQESDTAVRLGYLYPSHRHWLVIPFCYSSYDFFPVLF